MTSPTPHADDLIAAYAVDAVDPAERRLVEEHLDDCAHCREEVALYTEAAVHLSDGIETEPPLRLREQVLGAVAEQAAAAGTADPGSASKAGQHRRQRGPAAIWGLAAAGLVAVGGFAAWQGLGSEDTPIEQVVQADDAQRSEVDYEGETLAVVASDSLDRAVLLTDELPTLEEGQIYQAWWVDEAGQITSAGLVEGGQDPADVEMPLEGDPEGIVAVALSVEPEGGSQQPTTDPLLQIELAG